LLELTSGELRNMESQVHHAIP